MFRNGRELAAHLSQFITDPREVMKMVRVKFPEYGLPEVKPEPPEYRRDRLPAMLTDAVPWFDDVPSASKYRADMERRNKGFVEALARELKAIHKRRYQARLIG